MNKVFIAALSIFITFFSCTSNKKSGESVKLQQYYVEGEQLYLAHCSNCHQKSGAGLGLLYPPLNESDYMEQNLDEVICLIKNGKSGELMVNKKTYNQPMPGVPTLTNLEIAEIATYIYNTWSHENGLIELKQVTQVILKCKSADQSGT